MSLFAEHIIDLYKNPLNHGALKHASTSHRSFNPLCGDDISVDLLFKKNRLKDIRHRGIGCAISQASISLLSEYVKGKTPDQILKIPSEKVTQLLGISLGPVRLKCALLGLEAIHQATLSYVKKRPHS